MRYLIAVILCLASYAAADESSHEKCSMLSLIGEVIMEQRQNGFPMRDAMELAGGEPFISAIVKDAYSVPLMDGEEKAWTVIEFQNQVYAACLGFPD